MGEEPGGRIIGCSRMNRAVFPFLCISIVAIAISGSALIISVNSSRQAEVSIGELQTKIHAMEQRTPGERAYAAGRLADELADGFITADDAAERFRQLMSDAPDLLAMICRDEGTEDTQEACKRRIVAVAKQRLEQRAERRKLK